MALFPTPKSHRVTFDLRSKSSSKGPSTMSVTELSPRSHSRRSDPPRSPHRSRSRSYHSRYSSSSCSDYSGSDGSEYSTGSSRSRDDHNVASPPHKRAKLDKETSPKHQFISKHSVDQLLEILKPHLGSNFSAVEPVFKKHSVDGQEFLRLTYSNFTEMGLDGPTVGLLDEVVGSPEILFSPYPPTGDTGNRSQFTSSEMGEIAQRYGLPLSIKLANYNLEITELEEKASVHLRLATKMLQTFHQSDLPLVQNRSATRCSSYVHVIMSTAVRILQERFSDFSSIRLGQDIDLPDSGLVDALVFHNKVVAAMVELKPVLISDAVAQMLPNLSDAHNYNVFIDETNIGKKPFEVVCGIATTASEWILMVHNGHEFLQSKTFTIRLASDELETEALKSSVKELLEAITSLLTLVMAATTRSARKKVWSKLLNVA